jgi:NAD(P) transhydrogenase subunit alpha
MATTEELLAQARAALDQANAAAAKAQGVLDQLGGAAAAHGGAGGIDPFVFQFSIFVMAIFVGYYVVWSVTPALHTPLMSVTNAISSVIIVGALLATGVDFGTSGASPIFGAIAVALASVNIFGGFLVTNRMLAMYKKKS